MKELEVILKNELSLSVLDKDFFTLLLRKFIDLKNSKWEQDVCLSWTSKQ